jgi:hypothetical protein
MKKLIVFLSLFAFIAIGINAQTVVTSDKVIHYTYGDTLIKDATFYNTYYVKPYALNARLTLEIDTMASAVQHPKVNAILSRSVNNLDWYSVAGDTVVAASTIASGHKIATSGLIGDIYAPYLKVTVKAIDSTQNSKVKYYLLIQKNQ